MTNPEIVLGILGTVTTIGGSYVALRLRPLEKDIETNEKARIDDKKDSIDANQNLRNDFERRMAGLHDDSKAERENFERRLSGIERTYASREELAAAINSIGGRFDRGIDRVEETLKSIGGKVDDLGARLGRVEAR